MGLTGLGVGCVIAALPFALVEAISDAVKDQKYKKARDEFGQNIIESLKLMKERYHHVNAFHQAHREV